MIETVELQEQLQQKWMIFEWALAIGLCMLGIAWRQGAFRPFRASFVPVIQGKEVLKGFGLFLSVEIIVLPALFSLLYGFIRGESINLAQLSEVTKGWLNLATVLGGFGGALCAYFQLIPAQRQQLWKQTATPWYYQIGIGIGAWCVCYPLVLAFNEVVSLIVWHLFHHSTLDQIAVQNLRKVLEYPWLFGWTALAIVTFVPWTEEFLFRGLLQNWLKQRLHHPALAIGLSSLVFAFFHYSHVQGITNIELLSSLFLLSCVLGFLYERQRSLWASVGLHGFFNLMSLLLIFRESSMLI